MSSIGDGDLGDIEAGVKVELEEVEDVDVKPDVSTLKIAVNRKRKKMCSPVTSSGSEYEPEAEAGVGVKSKYSGRLRQKRSCVSRMKVQVSREEDELSDEPSEDDEWEGMGKKKKRKCVSTSTRKKIYNLSEEQLQRRRQLERVRHRLRRSRLTDEEREKFMEKYYIEAQNWTKDKWKEMLSKFGDNKVRNPDLLPGKDLTNQELEEACKKIPEEWKSERNIVWEADSDGRLQMTRTEMLSVRYKYRKFLERMEMEEEDELEGTRKKKRKYVRMPNLTEEERRQRYREVERLRAKRERENRTAEQRQKLAAEARIRHNCRQAGLTLKERKKFREKYRDEAGNWTNSQWKEWLRNYRGEDTSISVREPEQLKGKHLTDRDLEEVCKKIPEDWKSERNIAWEVDHDGRLQMTRKEMLAVRYKYQKYFEKTEMTEEKAAELRRVKSFKAFVKKTQWSEERRERERNIQYMRYQARRAKMTKEELEREREKIKLHGQSMSRERKRKYAENYRNRLLQNAELKAAKLKRHLQLEKERRKLETPEQLYKRRMYGRIAQAKRKLRAKLEAAGASPEEIQKRIDEVVRRITTEPLPPPEKIKPYTPKPELNQRRQQANDTHNGMVAHSGTSTDNLYYYNDSNSSYHNCDYASNEIKYESVLPPPEQIPTYKPEPKPRRNQRKEPTRASASLRNNQSEVTAGSTQEAYPYPSSLFAPLTDYPDYNYVNDRMEARLETADNDLDYDDYDDCTYNGLSPSSHSPGSPSGETSAAATSSVKKVEEGQTETKTGRMLSPALPSISSSSFCFPSIKEVEAPLSLRMGESIQPSSSLSQSKSGSGFPPHEKCPHCPSTFMQVAQLQAHIRTSHGDKCWECPKCDEIVLSPKDLADHFKSHHNPAAVAVEKDKSKSSECEHEPKSKAKTSRSRHQHHQPRPRSVSSTAKHLKKLDFLCIKCPKITARSQFETLEQLSNHVQQKHPKSFWPCSQCKLLKYNSSSLNLHLKICKR